MDHTIASSSAFRWALALFILGLFAQHALAAEPVVLFATSRTVPTYHEIRVLRQMTNFNPGDEALIDELSLTVIAQ